MVNKMLNKKVCISCINNAARKEEGISWNEKPLLMREENNKKMLDEDIWDVLKMIACPDKEVTTIKKIPWYCKYKLEHIVSKS